jgi:hypothetical protein
MGFVAVLLSAIVVFPAPGRQPMTAPRTGTVLAPPII